MTVAQKESVISVVETRSTKDNDTSNPISMWFSDAWRPVAAELLCMFILVLVGCMANIPIDGLPYQNPIYGPLAFGLAVLINIQTFDHISGAHMNPAVTLASVMYGRLSIPSGIAYIIAQSFGAILGYGVLMLLSPECMVSGGICVTIPHPKLHVLQALGIEILLTSIYNFFNCSLWDPVNEHLQDSVPIKYGLTRAGLSLAGAPLTGASMNPARSLGPAVWTGWWTMHWIYWVGPFIGGILPVVIYKLLWYNMRARKNK